VGSAPARHFAWEMCFARLVTAVAMEEFLRAAPEFHLTSPELSGSLPPTSEAP